MPTGHSSINCASISNEILCFAALAAATLLTTGATHSHANTIIGTFTGTEFMMANDSNLWGLTTNGYDYTNRSVSGTFSYSLDLNWPFSVDYNVNPGEWNARLQTSATLTLNGHTQSMTGYTNGQEMDWLFTLDLSDKSVCAGGHRRNKHPLSWPRLRLICAVP